MAKVKAKKSKKRGRDEVLRYRVTQPVVRGEHAEAHFPEFTTRIGSNEHYIFAANHPRWHEAAVSSEDSLVEHMNEDRVRAMFAAESHLLGEITPIVLYGFVLIRLMRRFVDANLGGDQELRSALNNALGTVANNLSQVIFQDPRQLSGERYSVLDFLRWQRNLEIFESMDVFAYRPPELGKDVDGRRKPIIELCPAPKLGRHLVRLGYRILADHVSRRCPGQAELARIYQELLARRAPMSVCLLPRQEITTA